MNHLAAIALLVLTALSAVAVTPDQLYKAAYWQIESDPGKVQWVEIHNISEALQSGTERWRVKRSQLESFFS